MLPYIVLTGYYWSQCCRYGELLVCAGTLFPWAFVRVQAEQKGGMKQNWSYEKRMLPRRATCFCTGRIGACYLWTWGRTKKLSSQEHVQVSLQLLFPHRFSRFFTIYHFVIATKEQWELYNSGSDSQTPAWWGEHIWISGLLIKSGAYSIDFVRIVWSKRHEKSACFQPSGVNFP